MRDNKFMASHNKPAEMIRKEFIGPMLPEVKKGVSRKSAASYKIKRKEA